jgi:hypothetical protein
MPPGFDMGGGGCRPRPVDPSRVGQGARPAVFLFLLVMALVWGTLIAAAYEAFCDMEERGEMDPTW